jgi:hypothetical protein
MLSSKLKEIGLTVIALSIMIGFNSANAQWQTNGTSIYYNNGNVGIGNTSPAYKLCIYLAGDSRELIEGTTGAALRLKTGAGCWEFQQTDASGGARFRLNQINPSVVGDVLTITNTTFNVGLGISSPGCKLQVNGGAAIGFSSSKTPPTNGLAVSGAVVIGSGSINPGNALLAVNGQMKAREVVATVTGWPDYVFSPTYSLKSIKDVEHYVKTNRHLEGIPTAEEVQDKGLPLAEMQGKFLKKLEETTLYLIELKKENEALTARLNALEQKKD